MRKEIPYQGGCQLQRLILQSSTNINSGAHPQRCQNSLLLPATNASKDTSQ